MRKLKAVVLHGAGYVGVELCALLRAHPHLELACVTSRSQAGKPIWTADKRYRGTTDLVFTSPEAVELTQYDVIFNCAEHGAGAEALAPVLQGGYAGSIVDLSADFRLSDPADYPKHYGWTHPHPALLPDFSYGISELQDAYPDGSHVANPGCFATGLALATAPIARAWPEMVAQVTALTGASGSGARAKPTTHFPRRDNSVSAYKILDHQHLPEVLQCLPSRSHISFIPASGPWVRGIWGTVQIQLPDDLIQQDAGDWFRQQYAGKPFVRLLEHEFPVLREVVDTPFCDIGWVQNQRHLAVGFALDNLLKGAASQAIQNMNRLRGWPEETGLL